MIAPVCRSAGLPACFLFGCILANAAAGQVAVVVPNATATAEGLGTEPFLFNGNDGRTQVVIDRAQLGTLAARPIRAITLRRDAHLNEAFPQGMKGGWLDLLVTASWTRRDPLNPSATFAANHDSASSPVVVFRGEYRVVDSPKLASSKVPASFDPSVSAQIVLQHPILPAAAGNLCIDIVHRRHSTKPAPEAWLGDGFALRPPPIRFLGTSCWRPGHAERKAARFDTNTYVGAQLEFTSLGPKVPAALLVLGASDERYGLLKLPFDLGPLGASGCLLYVSLDFMLPAVPRSLALVSDTLSRVRLPIPYETRLVGAQLHSQWFFYQPGVNALSMTTTNAASVVLSANPGIGVGLVQALDPTAATGDVYVNMAPVLRLSDASQ